MDPGIRLRVIIAIQVLGSAYAAVTFPSVFPGFESDSIVVLLYCLVMGVSVLGVASGLFLWFGKSFGYWGSIATHAIQIPMIVSAALTYKFAFGVGVFLKIFGPIKLVALHFGASTILVWMTEQDSAAVAINLYALVALMYLIRDWNTQNEQNTQLSA